MIRGRVATPRTRTPWRVRMRALASMVEAALISAVDLGAILLDRRPASLVALEMAGRLGSCWRRHLHAARVRAYGPGRGVIAVVLHSSDTPHTHRKDT